MGIKTIYVSDLSGEVLPDDTKPIPLTYAEKSVSLYLTDKEATALEKAIAKYLDAGTPIATPAVKAKAKTDTKAARKWLQDNGYELGDRGRIPKEMMDVYNTNA